MRVALTFDDGPSQWTEPILDILRAHDARATFFLVGANIYGRESTVWRMLDEGHVLGNHSFNHPHMTTLSDVEAWDELERTTDLIENLTAETVTMWRAPHLETNATLNNIGTALGLTHIGATVDTHDWQATKNAIVGNLTRQLHDGAIVLLHDGMPPDGGSGSRTRDATVQGLSEALVGLCADFVPVPELQAVSA